MSPTPRFVRRLASAPVGAEQRVDPTAISLRVQQGAAPPPWGSERRAREPHHGGSDGGLHQQKQ
eukprot:1106594-Prymnesium_polylepis.1